MSQFNLNKAQIGGSNTSTKLPPGQYRVRIEKNFIKESEDRKRALTTYFISEFTVVAVNSGGLEVIDKHGNLFPATKAGDYRSWSNNMAHANAAGSLNEFLVSVDGLDPKSSEAEAADKDQLLEDAIDPKNPMRGAEVDVMVVLKLTEGKNHYPVYRFSVAA
jgi:hypothetical protein